MRKVRVVVQISKSEYMMFLKHPIYLWLKKYDKSKLPPVDDALQAIFNAGHIFESFAEQLLPNSTKLGFSSYGEYISLTSRTKKLLKEVTANLEKDPCTILQARFESEIENVSLTCICDAIVVTNQDYIDLYEIKSGTRVKLENMYDLAFQVSVVEASGLKVKNIYVINADSSYVRKGDINVEDLCVTTEVTEEVRELTEFTLEQIALMRACIKSKNLPELQVPSDEDGAEALNSWLELHSIFNKIEPGSIFDLCWPKNRIAKLHTLGIKNLTDIEDDFDLTPKQRAQVSAAKSKEQYIDRNVIKEFLDQFVYPIYFLDYETLMDVIPPFDGTSPYQQIPFQYSLHILDSPDADLRHEMYLHRSNSDPVIDLAKHLSTTIGPNGSVVTWNANFEKGCNSRMAKMHPEYAEFFESVNERVVDLAIPFQQNSFVDHRFLGSYSIKKVLPVLVPELSYKDLGINEGLAAQRKWMQAVLEEKFSDAERIQILDDLEKYCELDTLAMVEIYRFLKRIID